MRPQAEIHELRRLRKRAPFPIPEDACRIIGAFGGRTPPTGGGVRFKLRKLRRGTEIMFSVSTGPNTAFSWNISHYQKVYPKTFGEARRWVHAYAAGFGQIVEEVRKERMPTAIGADRKLLRSGGCREAWLRSDIPQLWAEACVRCQHAGAFCGQDGYCHLGGCDMEMDPAPAESKGEG